MAEADDNKIGPDDPRWPARATADLLMRGVLAARVREAGGFPELVPALRRARHVRKPTAEVVQQLAVHLRAQVIERHWSRRT